MTSDTKGFTLIELMVVTAVIGIISALAVPVLLRARLSSNEASAIGSLRVINSAETTYASSCAFNGYAQTLADLAKPPAASNSGFISPDLAADPSSKSGYMVHLDKGSTALDVAMAATTCNGSSANAVSSYFAGATPIAVGLSGRRSFATDGHGTIYEDGSGIAMAESDLSTAVPIQ